MFTLQVYRIDSPLENNFFVDNLIQSRVHDRNQF